MHRWAALQAQLESSVIPDIEDVDGVDSAEVVGAIGQRITITPDDAELAAAGAAKAEADAEPAAPDLAARSARKALIAGGARSRPSRPRSCGATDTTSKPTCGALGASWRLL